MGLVPHPKVPCLCNWCLSRQYFMILVTSSQMEVVSCRCLAKTKDCTSSCVTWRDIWSWCWHHYLLSLIIVSPLNSLGWRWDVLTYSYHLITSFLKLIKVNGLIHTTSLSSFTLLRSIVFPSKCPWLMESLLSWLELRGRNKIGICIRINGECFRVFALFISALKRKRLPWRINGVNWTIRVRHLDG